MMLPDSRHPHLNGNGFNGDGDTPANTLALSADEELSSPQPLAGPAETAATEPLPTPAPADADAPAALAITRHLTPIRYHFAVPLADVPQVDLGFVAAAAQDGDEAGAAARVAAHHRHLHIMARGGEIHTLERKRESVLASLRRIVAGIGALDADLSRLLTFVKTPSAVPARPWTWWEAAGATAIGTAALGCLGADVHTYWVNLMESGVHTFVEHPVSAGFYGALALVVPFSLKFALGRFGRKDGRPCLLTRSLVALLLVGALAAFVAFAMGFRSPGEAAAGFGSLADAGAAHESALPHRVFTVLLMLVTGMLSALLGHWLSLMLDEHRLGASVENPQRPPLRKELERLQLFEHEERETLGAIEGKLAELRSEQEVLVNHALREYSFWRDSVRRDAARLARLEQAVAASPAALPPARKRSGTGRLAAWVVAGLVVMHGLTGCGSRPAGPITAPQEVRQTVFAVSPALPPETRDALFAAVGQWVLDAAPGDRLGVFDALNLRSVCEVAVPNEAFYVNNPRGREREFGPQMAALRAFLRRGAPAGEPARIMLPQFLSVLAQQRPSPRLAVVVVGSALYANPADPACDMTDGCFPADGHLAADPTLSPFSLRGKERSLAGALVYYIHSPQDFAAAGTPHQAGLQRFLTLYVGGLGGTLASFSPDLDGALRTARAGAARPVVEAAVNPGDDKPVMHRIAVRREVAASTIAEPRGDDARVMTDELTTREKTQTRPASSRVHHLLVGARWAAHADVDLYAARGADAPELFYGRTRDTEGGMFYKDFQDAVPTAINGLEAVEWNTPVDLQRASCWLNLYAGQVPAGVEVTVRVVADGRRYERVYRLPAASGNHGQNHAGRASDAHWVRVDLAEICGLRPDAQ